MKYRRLAYFCSLFLITSCAVTAKQYTYHAKDGEEPAIITNTYFIANNEETTLLGTPWPDIGVTLIKIDNEYVRTGASALFSINPQKSYQITPGDHVLELEIKLPQSMATNTIELHLTAKAEEEYTLQAAKQAHQIEQMSVYTVWMSDRAGNVVAGKKFTATLRQSNVIVTVPR